MGGISVPFGGSDVPTEFEINLCPYHSGEVYADPSLDWNASVDNGMLNFSCDDFSSNPEATAILWQYLIAIVTISLFALVGLRLFVTPGSLRTVLQTLNCIL